MTKIQKKSERLMAGTLLLLASWLASPPAVQGQDMVWIRQFGTDGAENNGSPRIAGDANGDTYVVGTVAGTFPGQTSAGLTDALIQKYTSAGDVLWTRQFGTSGGDDGADVIVDPGGYVYVAGYKGSTGDAYPGQTNMGGTDAYVRKFEPSGTVIWTRQFGTASNDSISAISADSDGNICVAGVTAGAFPGQTNTGLADVFVRKCDPDGNIVWTRQFGTTGSDGAAGICVNAEGEIYVAGYVAGALPGQADAGINDAYIRKYDADGNEIWTRQFHGTASYASERADGGMGLDRYGNIYVAGKTYTTFPGQTSSGSQDIFVCKYDPSGNMSWVRQFGSSGMDIAYGSTVDPGGNCYVAGYVAGLLPGQTNLGGGDAFIRKYNATGNEIWTRQFGSTNSDAASGCSVAANGGHIQVCGNTYGTLPGQTNWGSADLFVAQFSQPESDFLPPTIAAPANIVAEATSPAGAAVTFTVTVEDQGDPGPLVTLDHESGSTFALGETLVTVNAIDASSNSATASFTVTVVDTTAPAIAAPSNIVAEATGPNGAAVAFSVIVADLADTNPVVNQDHASGSIFSFGETLVTVTATDDSSNTATTNFTVTVVDSTAPAITVPADIVAEATGPEGAAVEFVVSATDLVDSDPAVSADQTSGNVFPIGETVVTATATDASNNVATASFLVTVMDMTDSEGAYGGGIGTQADPYRISKVADWVELMGATQDWDKHFLLTTNLYFGGMALTPVGNSATKFSGIFDGNGHVLRNAVINRPDENRVGVFGMVVTGRIQSVGAENITVRGNSSVGILAGQILFGGVLEDSYATGTVSGGVSVGGLVGDLYHAKLTACHAAGAVSGDRVVGGLVGDLSYDSILAASYATGSVSNRVNDQFGCYGGLVGLQEQGSVITNSHAAGPVWGCNTVGGLVGRQDGGTTIAAYSASPVMAVSNEVGGLVGALYNGTITDSYAMGSVRGNYTVGGLIGYQSGGAISASYSKGQVTLNGMGGGMVGGKHGGTISASYWDKQTSGQTSSGGGEGRTTDEMTYPYATNTYVGWNFGDIWAADSAGQNNGYPFLRFPPAIMGCANIVVEYADPMVVNYDDYMTIWAKDDDDSNPALSIVPASGSAFSVGETVVTVTAIDASGNAATANFTVTVLKATPVVAAWPSAAAIVYGQTLADSTLTGGEASIPGTFAFTAPALAPGVGTADQGVIFTPTDTVNYNAVTGTVPVTVSKLTPEVTIWPTASAIVYGQTLADSTLSGGAASVAGVFAFTAPGTVPNAGTAEQAVTFTPADPENYNVAESSVSVTVAKADPVVSVWPTASTIEYGQTLADATLSGGEALVAGTFAFTAPATAPAVGTADQAVTFTPTDAINYNAVAGSVSVTTTDSTAPAVVCKDATLLLDASGNGMIAVDDVLASASDAGGIAESTVSQTHFDCANLGVNAVTVRVMDVAGNIATCTANVTVRDNIPTVLSGCPADITVNSDAEVPAPALVTATDNCAGTVDVIFMESETNPGSNCSNTITRTWRAASSGVTFDGGTVVTWGNGDTAVPAGLSNVIKVASGYYHTLALKMDGTVTAWGANNYGQSTVPAELRGVVDISGGKFHSLALKSDGTVIPWGLNDQGQGVDSRGLSGIIKIAAGGKHNLTMGADGTMSTWGCWGWNDSHQLEMPDCSLNGVVEIAAGYYHSLALLANGTVVAWGNNVFGQCAVPAGLNNVIRIAAGEFHSVALKTDGTVVTWGSSGGGGPAGLNSVVDIAAGEYTTMALKVDGTVVAWGNNGNGQCNVPAGLSNVIGIAAGVNHNYALVGKSADVAPWHTQTITVRDLIVPAVATKDIAISLDGNGNASIVPEDVDAGTTDNSGAMSLALDKASFSCTDVGTNWVILTAIDSCGNSTSMTATVTVKDDMAPVLIGVPEDVAVNSNAIPEPAVVIATDNCNSSVIVEYNETDEMVAGIRTITRTWAATDASGNNKTARQMITVITEPVLATDVTATSFTANWPALARATNYILDVSMDSGFSQFIDGYHGCSVGNVTTFIVTGLYANTTYYYRVRAEHTEGMSANVDAMPVLTAPMAPSMSVAREYKPGGEVLLDHFNGSSGASILAYSNGNLACDARLPAAVPRYSYGAMFNDLGQYLALEPPEGASSGSATFLQYPAYCPLSGSAKTIEFWVYLTSYGTGLGLVEQGLFYNACGGWTFGMGVNSNGQLSANAWAAFGMDSGTEKIPLLTWTHVAASWGGNGAKLYINGVQVGSDASTGLPAGGYGGNLLIRLGTHAGASARIDELRVSNGQLTNFTAWVPVVATNISAASFHANWLASAGATNYFIDVATDIGFTSFVAGYQNLLVGDVVTKSVTGLSPASTYYYRVRAQNSGGTSDNSSTIAVTLNKADQTITFPAIVNQVTTNTVGLAATASSGLAVSFAVESGSATITGGTNLVFAGAGSVSIVASQAGDGNWNGAVPVTNTFTVTKADPGVSVWPTASMIAYGQSLTDATLSGGEASVPGVFAFTAPGTVPNAGTEDQAVTFTPMDTDNNNILEGNVSVTVAKANPEVTVWPTASMIAYGQTLADATLSGGEASMAGTFAFTTPETAPDAGTTDQAVTFTPADIANYNVMEGTISVTVAKADPVISVWPTASAIIYGQTLADSTLSGGEASMAGIFSFTVPATAPGVGTADQSLTFTPEDAANYNVVEGSASVTVSKADSTVSVWPIASAIIYGQTLADSTLSGGEASVPGTFAFTAPAAAPGVGTADQSVTFTPADAANYNVVEGSVPVTVSKADPVVSTWPTASAIMYGQTLADSVLSGGEASVAGSFAFTTPDTTPDAGTSEQSATFTPADGANYNTVVFDVEVTVNKPAPAITVDPTASAIVYGQALADSVLSGGEASVAGNFAFTAPGTAPDAGTSEQSVTFTPTDAANYSTVALEVSVTVAKADPSVTVDPTASSIVYGQTLAESILSGGETSVAGAFAFTAPGTAPGAGTADQSATFTPEDPANYNAVTFNVSVTVNKADPAVTTWPTASSIVYGQTLAESILGGGEASVAGTFTFTAPTTSPDAGTADQTVIFTPADTANYNVAEGTISVTVAKADPEISVWPTAATISYGQTLADATLSGGETSVAGAFAFTAPETVPELGTADQAVIFTPADEANYNPIAGTVSVTVLDNTPPQIEGCTNRVLITASQAGLALPELVTAVDNVDPAPQLVYAPPLGTILELGEHTINIEASDSAGNTATNSLVLTVAYSQVIAWGDENIGDCNIPVGLTNIVAIEAGDYCNLALHADGTVTMFGGEFPAEWYEAAASQTEVVAIAAGLQHALALHADGTVTAWGDNTYGQCDVPPEAANAVAIAAGREFSMALRSDGTVVAWGRNDSKQCDVPAGLTDFIAIAAGYCHGLAVRANGTVVAWGGNPNGDTPYGVPDGLTDVVAVAAGDLHSLALKADGTVVAWGDEDYGLPNVPEGLADAVAIAAGENHSLALRADGTVVAWGGEGYNMPGVPEELSDVMAIAGGSWHNLALVRGTALEDDDTAPVIFGDEDRVVTTSNPDGGTMACQVRVFDETDPRPTVTYDPPLGAALPLNEPTTIQVTATDASGNSVASSFAVTVQYVAGPEIVAWGRNDYGECDVPEDLTDVVQVAAGSGYGLALQADGTVAAWGSDDYGQCSDTEGLSDVIKLVACSYNGMALHADGTVSAWGNNDYGQCDVPAEATGVVAIAGCQYNFLALRNDGTVVAWGDAGGGEYRMPSGLSGVVDVAAGEGFNLALRADGTVVGWGDNANGACNAPADLTDAVAIAAGHYHSLALKSDGTVVAWGWNGEGACDVPPGLSNVVAVSGAENHSLALLADGTVVAWGNNGNAQCTIPAGLGRVRDISAGTYFSLALVRTTTLEDDTTAPVIDGTEDRVVTTSNPDGALMACQVRVVDDLDPRPTVTYDPPLGTLLPLNETTTIHVTATDASGNSSESSFTVTVQYTPVEVVAWSYDDNGDPCFAPERLNNVVAIAGGPHHNLALKADGTVVAWGGHNDYGECDVPADLTNAVAIAASWDQSAALRADGTAVAWGMNDYGQCNVPSGLNDAVKIASSPQSTHMLALRADGTVVAWGNNDSGQCDVPNLSAVVDIAAGYGHSLALRADGTAVGWGMDSDGQCSGAEGLTDVAAIAAGERHSLALLADGTVVGWGNDDYGQCSGAEGLTDVVAIAAGGYHSLALLADGSVVVWGNTENGQADIPADLQDVTAISAGYRHSLALVRAQMREEDETAPMIFGCDEPRIMTTPDPVGEATMACQVRVMDDTDPRPMVTYDPPLGALLPMGTNIVTVTAEDASGNTSSCEFTVTARRQEVIAWGGNEYGQCNIPNGLVDVVGIAAGWGNAWALRADHTIIGWGNNEYGQSSLPLFVTNAVAIAAGGNYNLILKSDGTVAGGGMDENGQVGVPAGLSDVKAISAGRSHDLAAKLDGTVVAWGDDSYGQCDVPAEATDVVAVAASWDSHSLALRADGTVVAWGNNIDDECNVPEDLTDAVAIAAGLANSMAVRADGSVQVWGNNEFNQCEVPAEATDVTAIAAGTWHILALKSDGTVVAWGYNGDGECDVPEGLTNIVAVAAGDNHSLALRADGTVVAWGNSGDGRCDVPEGLTDVVAIDGGDNHSLALKSDGTVVVWGHLENGPVLDRWDIVSLAGGAAHTLALRTNGTVVAWGENGNGQCDVPAGLTDAVAIAARENHSLALRANSQVVAWGNNDSGQCDVPADLVDAVAIAAGYGHGVALRAGGTVVAWGDDSYGQCDVPEDLTNAVAVAAGGMFSLALRADGTVMAWGDNSGNQLEIPEEATDVVAIVAGSGQCLALRSDGTVVAWGENGDGRFDLPEGLTDVAAIAAGDAFNMALLRTKDLEEDKTPPMIYGCENRLINAVSPAGTINTSQVRVSDDADPRPVVSYDPPLGSWLPLGTTTVTVAATDASGNASECSFDVIVKQAVVVAWGGNDEGQCNVPDDLTDVAAVFGGVRHSFALHADGTVTAWGQNDYGQCDVPENVTDIMALAGGWYHSLALKADGTVAAWGNNDYGQCNVPEDLSNVAAIAAGEHHNLALQADGTVEAWGINANGECNVPADLADVVAIAAGWNHSLALKSDGTVEAWGANYINQCDVPADLTDVVAISAKGHQSLALKSNGTLVAWGNNDSGQCDIPEDVTGVVAIAVGERHCLALLGDGTVRAWGDTEDGRCDVPTGMDHVVAIAAGETHSLALLGTGVADTTPPEITGCGDTHTAVSLNGTDAAVEYGDWITVTDDKDPSPTVEFDPPSGSTLAIGAHQVTVTAWDAAGNTNTCEFTVRVDAARLEVNRADVNVREGGEGRFFVRLDGQPTGTVVVGVSRSGGDTNLWVKGGATRTFKPTNWSAWQAVTLAAGADGNAGDETATFRVTAPGCADQYVTATALDVDLGENLALASGGATIAGTKAKSPAALIDGVHAASTNYGYATWTPAPGGTMTLDLKAAMAVTRVRLLNWDWANQANRYVIESSADGSSWTTVADAGGEGRQGWDDWAVAGDPIRYLRFTGLSNSANGCVMVSEWEVYGTRVAAKADQTIDFPAVGDQYATGSVLLSATASSGLPVGFAVASGPAALDGATLTFTGAGSVTIAASQGGDGSWNAAPEAVRTFAVLEPNPALEVDGTRTNVNVREGGEGRFFVRLGGEPASNVLVTVSRAGGESIAIQSGMTRTFTPANWSTWQAVVLAAAEDENGTNETATFRISAPGTADRYLPATALDDDIGENLARAAAGGAIAGPGSSRAAQLIDGVHTVSTNYGYTIWTNDPAGTMTLDLKQATVVSRVRLLNWDWVRRVHRYVIESSADGASWTPLADASAEDRQGWDDWAVSNQTARYLRFTGLSSSANGCVLVSELEVYGARAPLPRAELSKTAVNVREGGEGRFFVRPSSAPTGSVVFTVSRVAGESIAIQSGATRSFTALNWGTWQAVTLAAAGDENTGNETATFRISAPGHADSFVAATALDDDIGENMALATGGAEIAGWKASRAAQLIDGVHAASANYGHAVWTNDPPGTMTLDLKDEMAVSRVRVLNWDWVMQANRYRIESSTNKVDWKPLADASGEDRAGWDDWEVAGDPVRYLRITALSNSANGYVCIAELEVYGTRPAARKSPMASSSAVAESEPVSVLTSAGPEDESGWAAVDGDPETAWVGQQPGGGYLVVEYAPALTLKALAVDLAETSPANVECLYSLDAKEWLPLPEGLETNPVSLNFLWLVFPDDGAEALPEVLEIRANP